MASPIVNLHSKKALDVPWGAPDASPQDVTGLQQYSLHGGPNGEPVATNQLWDLLPTPPSNGIGNFKIRSQATGEFLTVPLPLLTQERTQVVQQADVGNPGQVWNVYLADIVEERNLIQGSVERNFIFYILNGDSGLVLDVRGASTEDGAVVQQFHYHGGPNQLWQLEKT